MTHRSLQGTRYSCSNFRKAPSYCLHLSRNWSWRSFSGFGEWEKCPLKCMAQSSSTRPQSKSYWDTARRSTCNTSAGKGTRQTTVMVLALYANLWVTFSSHWLLQWNCSCSKFLGTGSLQSKEALHYTGSTMQVQAQHIVQMPPKMRAAYHWLACWLQIIEKQIHLFL